MTLLYRFLIACATLIAIATFWADWREDKFTFMPKYSIGIILLFLSAVSTYYEYKKDNESGISLVASKNKKSIVSMGSVISGSQVTNFDASDLSMSRLIEKGVTIKANNNQNSIISYGFVITDSRVSINQGDSAEKKENKLKSTKASIATDVLDDIAIIDSRITYFNDNLKIDDTESYVRVLNKQIAPSLYLPTGRHEATGSEHGRPRCNEGLRGLTKAAFLAA